MANWGVVAYHHLMAIMAKKIQEFSARSIVFGASVLHRRSVELLFRSGPAIIKMIGPVLITALITALITVLTTMTVAFTFASIANAEDSSSADPSEFSLAAGYILPSRIPGMDQVMPIWGLRYGLPVSFGVVEFEGVNSHAYGSDYYNVMAGVRGNSPIFPGANFIYFVGIDETVYRPSTEAQNLNHLGFHFGGGLMMRIVDSIWFRSDARFINAPGSILAVEVGLVYRAL